MSCSFDAGATRDWAVAGLRSGIGSWAGVGVGSTAGLADATGIGWAAAGLGCSAFAAAITDGG